MTTGSAASIHQWTKVCESAEKAEIIAERDQLKLRVLGAAVSVVLEAGVTPDLYAELRRVWSRCLDESDEWLFHARDISVPASGRSQERPFQATVSSTSGTTTVAAGTFREFASNLTTAVTLAGITECRGDLVMLHGAALAEEKTGRAVALVGRSGMGKTTATKRLGAGLGYITDETVGVDASGRIVPYAKPLSLIVGDPAAPKKQVGPDDLELLMAPAAPMLASLVLLDRNPDAADPKVVPLSHAEAIIELAPHTSSLGDVNRPLSRLCGILDATGGAVRVSYREAGDLAAVLAAILERPAISKTWRSVLAEDTQATQGLPHPDAVRSMVLKRAELLDAVEFPLPDGQGTELIAMTGQGVVRLTGIGPAIWRALATPCDLNGIAGRIASLIGLPEGYESHLLKGVEELKFHGILLDSSATETSES
ncbi:hypothetical protein [Paenarthrobacter aurescens]|uniref:Uncharacterized protein n=1 Tax=Paenarthrobacter aurescens TaxID=43663 RepID=A0A4Y3NLG0_PAEAU|nr:hypothetical protein [Paenarthrobacter aurescens]MDO6145580.1 hypothetical protein [Paenarthrobacter aurescens]MDO6149389.1 hypothetical protein [Paenarthrobacter aurescens]MDO6160629.1 hypothetical protein [Paenarthrobacter aurescens]MDO6164488.1 hypothetical protein [Paenarthrobacter aurescens]GEB20026.1 hypothetical protein AAU01_27810 [Paenarthrobacter aurescens]